MTHTNGISRRRLRPGRWLIPPVLAFFVAVVAGNAESLVLVVAAGGACVLVWLAMTVLRRPLNAVLRRTTGKRLGWLGRWLCGGRGLGILLALTALAIALVVLLPTTRPASGYAALALLTALAASACTALVIDREITSWGTWFTSLGGRVVGGVAIVSGCLLAALAAGDAAALLPWPTPPAPTSAGVFIPADPDDEAIFESYGTQHDLWHAVSATAALERLVYGPPPRPPLEHRSVKQARSYLASRDGSVLRLVEGTSVVDRGLVPGPDRGDRAMLARALEQAELGDDPLLAYRLAVVLGDSDQAESHEDAAAQRVATPEERGTLERTRAGFRLRQGDYAAAIAGYEAALANRPEDAFAHADLAIAILLERERLLAWIADGRLDAASFDWGAPDALLERALSAFLEALVHMDRSTITYTHALSNAGWAYSAMGDPETAHAFYDRALARDRALLERWSTQDSVQHYLATPLANLGRVHLDLGHYAAAADNFTEAIAAQRSHWGASHASIPPLLRLLGRALEGDGQTEGAIVAYREAVRIARDLAGNWRERAPVGDAEAMPEHDRAWLDEQIEQDAFDELPHSLGALMNCLVRERRFEEALEPTREALDFARWLLPEGDPVIETWETNVRMAEFGAELEAQREAGGG
ncbi:MAG: tetratricopeptide repeat protein [Phycisphaerales bacterium JB064]